MSSREITIILAVLVGIVLLVPVLSMSMMGFSDIGHRPMGPVVMNGPGSLFAFLLIASVVLLVVVLSRRSGPDLLDLLRERLAKGEMTRDQYEEIKRVLQSSEEMA